jgi:dipeptidyl aminopeptidase/acylaminoacyl peptidase
MTYVADVKTPTLIYHGDQDRRVPLEQGEQLYVALRERKVPVEFVRYPREGHALAEYWHQLDALERSLGWFDRYVKGKK